jgi:hypothetical protein
VIDLDSELEKPPAMFCRVIDNDGSCSIVFHGKEVAGPAKVVDALRFIAAQKKPFTGRQISGNLRESEVLILLKKTYKRRIASPTLGRRNQLDSRENSAATRNQRQCPCIVRSRR